MSDLQDLIDAGILDKNFADELPPIVDMPRVRVTPSPEPLDVNLLNTSVRHRGNSETGFEHARRPGVRAYTQPSVLSDDDSSSDDFDMDYFRNVNYHWLYSGNRSPGWWHYPQVENDKLERKYKAGKSHTHINVGTAKMVVDFNEMTQRHKDSFRNVIRLDTLNDVFLKGVAGRALTKQELMHSNEPSGQDL